METWGWGFQMVWAIWNGHGVLYAWHESIRDGARRNDEWCWKGLANLGMGLNYGLNSMMYGFNNGLNGLMGGT